MRRVEQSFFVLPRPGAPSADDQSGLVCAIARGLRPILVDLSPLVILLSLHRKAHFAEAREHGRTVNAFLSQDPEHRSCLSSR